MASPSAKICGIKTKDAAQASLQHGASFLGFVHFEKSPRHIEPADAAKLTWDLPLNVRTAAVIVDKTVEEVQAYLKQFVPNYLQLHGSETLDYVKELRAMLPAHIGIIKAISVRSGDDIAAAHAYTPHIDMLMFDAKAPAGGLPGGNALSFDWALLKDRSFDKPWFLSGGLNADNVEEAVRLSGARLVDVSSSVESAPGVKDPALIEHFLTCLKRIAL